MPYGPEGNPLTARLVLVGEAPARNEIIEGRPFIGMAGAVLNECLESAGILRSECYTTNLFDFRVTKGVAAKKAYIYDDDGNNLWYPRGGLTSAASPHVERLWQELDDTTANVIVPMGGPALNAICGLHGILKWRGSIMPAKPPSGRPAARKTVSTIHPANTLHGQYTNRYIIKYDLERAIREASFPEINRPKYNFQSNITFHQCVSWLKWLRTQSPIAVDIEVAAGQVSYIAFAWSRVDAVSIPYGAGGWTVEQETELWQLTAQLLEDSTTTKIFQNGAFDVQFLFQVHDILVQGKLEDTMIGHHLIYPDFMKGLAFLASLYTDQPYWKDMVKHGEIDKEDG